MDYFLFWLKYDIISFLYVDRQFVDFIHKLTLVNSSFTTEIARLGSECE